MGVIERTVSGFWNVLKRCFDNDHQIVPAAETEGHTMDRVRTLPFIALHLSVLTIFWVGWSPVAVLIAVLLYIVRMFAITGFYHRYFSHRAFRTSRFMQFVFAIVGASAAQRGPLWWASNHRIHHSHSDQVADVHSPVQHGLWWSHMGWFLSYQQLSTKVSRITDFARFPELRFLDRFDVLVPFILAVILFFFGEWLGNTQPELGTNGWQMLVWGFVISTLAVYHGTFTINSLSHRFGTRRYATTDNSRNNIFLAIITLGEGWHNNHHRYASCARQGFRWWEIDITYYLLYCLKLCGLIWDIRPVPELILNEGNLSQDSDSKKIAG